MSVKAKHPDPRVEALVSDARNSGTDEAIIQQHLVPYFERQVKENPSVEQRVREDLGLSKKPGKEPERGPAEQIVRDWLEHEPLPVDPTAPEPERITVKQFLERHPSDAWYVDDKRNEGLGDREIESSLPYFVKTLSQNVEDEARQIMGVPKPHPREISEVEKRVRKREGLRPVK